MFTAEKVKIHLTRFSDLQLEELKAAVQEYERKKWINIGRAIGMSATGCKKMAKEKGFEV